MIIWFDQTWNSTMSTYILYIGLSWVGNRLINNKGSFNNYVDRILPFFTPSPPAWTVFIPWEWTRTDIFWPPPPPSSCPRSYWMAPFLVRTFAAGCMSKLRNWQISGVSQPFFSLHLIRSIWSVKCFPNPKSLTAGFDFSWLVPTRSSFKSSLKIWKL